MRSPEILSAAALQARALLLGARLDLRAWPESETLARMPLASGLPDGGVAVLFRYGVVVLFGVGAASEQALNERLAPLVEHPYGSVEREELAIRAGTTGPEGLLDGALVVQSLTLEKLQLIADVLSKSALLGHYESRMAAQFDRIEPLALELEQKGRLGGGSRAHVKRIGSLLLIESRMVGRAEIGDKPELLWEHPELERLYSLLDTEFEIRERLAALERKLDLVARTVRTLLDLIRGKHSLRVEWYIVGLIVVEILLTLYAMWLR